MSRITYTLLLTGLSCAYLDARPAYNPKPSTPVKPPAKTEEKYTFKNLVGDIPQDVKEVTDFIRNADKYTKMGAHMPRGILLVGPPGTGKTSIARAIAGEADAKFFSASAGEFRVMWVGEGERKIRELFQKARNAVKHGGHKKAIIFLDEIDSIAGHRGDFGNTHNRGILNELLAQMSGFNQSDSVFVIAATNRIQDIDSAIKRPGRFDRIVKVDVPNLSSRKAILMYYAKKIQHSRIDYDKHAKATDGMSGAELENIVNEAAIRAVRGNEPCTRNRHFTQAIDEIQGRL